MFLSCDQQGKYTAMFLCWILGTGSLFPWNSMLTTLDYYIAIFPVMHSFDSIAFHSWFMLLRYSLVSNDYYSCGLW